MLRSPGAKVVPRGRTLPAMESAAPAPFLEVPEASLWSARTASLMIRAFVGVMAASPQPSRFRLTRCWKPRNERPGRNRLIDGEAEKFTHR